MAIWQVGDRVRLGNPAASGQAAFVPIGGSATDPTAVTLTIRKPLGTTLAYGWPAAGPSGTLTKESAGRFYADLTFDEPGLWRCELKGTGVVEAAAQWTETVERRLVV